MPGIHVLWVYLCGLLTVVDDLLIVFVIELLNVLVGFDVLELPHAQLVMADTKQLAFDILRLFKKIHQDMLRLVEGVLATLRATLVVKSV